MAEFFDIRKEEYLSLRNEVENDLKEFSVCTTDIVSIFRA